MPKANLRIYQHGFSTTGNLGSYTGWSGTGAATVDVKPTTVTYNTTSARKGSSFDNIGSAAGKGHDAAYTFYDNQPINGTNYYRLKIMEADGGNQFSQHRYCTERWPKRQHQRCTNPGNQYGHHQQY